MSILDDFPTAYSMPTPVDAYTEGWPHFAAGWLGGEFRPRPRPAESSGWRCPGCTRCYGPMITQCRFCGPAEAQPGTSPQSRDLTWAPDALEPDEGT